MPENKDFLRDSTRCKMRIYIRNDIDNSLKNALLCNWENNVILRFLAQFIIIKKSLNKNNKKIFDISLSKLDQKTPYYCMLLVILNYALGLVNQADMNYAAEKTVERR